MLHSEPLRRHPALRTGSPDELLDWLQPVYAVRDLDMPGGARRFDTVINHRQLPSLGLTYARYGSPLRARLDQTNCFLQGFPIAGSGEVRWNGLEALVNEAEGGIVGGPGSEATIRYDGDFAHLILRLERAALTRKLSALIGDAVDPPIELTAGPAVDPARLAAQRRLMRFLAAELDESQAASSALVLDELQDAVIVSYLTSTEHNYSRHLQSTPRAAAPWQVRLATDFIEANWRGPVTVEAIANATGASARSLFSLFRRTHGVSPIVFLRRMRLWQARQMLCRGEAVTVTEVAFACGFGNLGHFAAHYFQAFGERPSETLRLRRRGSTHSD